MARSYFQHIGEKAQEARTLDGLGELALFLRGNRGNARWHDLAALGDEALQEPRVLIVDDRRVIAREGAGRRLKVSAHRRPKLLACSFFTSRYRCRYRCRCCYRARGTANRPYHGAPSSPPRGGRRRHRS